jgi:uncharacterized protein YkwD
MVSHLLSWFLQIKFKTLLVTMSVFLTNLATPVQIAKAPVIPKQTKVAVSKPSLKSIAPSKPICSVPTEDLPTNVDLEKVRATWLDWENTERTANGLAPYTYNEDLIRTATIWSEASKQKGYIDHKRPGQTAYYDYKIIEKWFKNLGLEFKNTHSKTFTESIAWEYYSCSDSDCTDKLTTAIRKGFNFFMSEKGKSSRPHYDAIINPEFTQIGIGIVVDKVAEKYYLTVHYGTEVTASGSLCGE